MRENSDLDVLVVMRDGTHRNRTCDKIYGQLWGIGFATDIVVVTESEIVLYRDDPYGVIHYALKDGRELYRAA